MCPAAFPAHEEATEAVVPRVGSLDDPPPRFAAHDAEERLLAPASDVRTDAAKADGRSHMRVVVALVEAEVLGATWTARGTKRHRVEDFANHGGIGHVRTRDECPDRNAAPVGQNVPLHPAFRAIRRVRPGEVPPFGAFTEAVSSELHSHAMPRRLS